MLSEFANYELGEAFFEFTERMVIRDGIPFQKIGDFDIVSPSWRKLADKENKTPEDTEKLDSDYKTSVIDLADSCTLYMGAKLKNTTYQFNYDEYLTFVKMVAPNKYAIPVNPPEILEYNKKIQTQFNKLANHGEETGDNLIDNKDFAAYIYALDWKNEHDENKKLTGFYLDGRITPLNYAVAYQQLREENDNMFTLKLREAYHNLFCNNS